MGVQMVLQTGIRKPAWRKDRTKASMLVRRQARTSRVQEYLILEQECLTVEQESMKELSVQEQE